MKRGSQKLSELRRSLSENDGYTALSGILGRSIYALLALLAFIAEVLLTYYFTYDKIDFSNFLLVHSLISISIFCCFFLTGTPCTNLSYRFLQLGIFTLIAGPFGVMIAAWLIVPARTSQHGEVEPSFNDWLDSEMSQGNDGELDGLYRDIMNRRLHLGSAETSGTIAFVDVFAHGTNEMKFRTLATIRRKFHPSFSYSLRLALQDENPSVRVLAATVISNLRAQQSENLVRLEGLLKGEPENSAHLIKLAEAHKSCQLSGLLEEKQSVHHLENAIHFLQLYCELAASDELACCKLARWQDEATKILGLVDNQQRTALA